MDQPKVLATIVCYEGEKWIQKCIESINQNNYENLQILIIDNASKDETTSIIETNFENIILFKLKSNVGYGRAANIGIRYAINHEYDYLFLLNQDLKLRPDCIMNMVQTCQTHSNVVIASPLQMTYDGSQIDPAFEKWFIESKLTINDIRKKKFKKKIFQVDSVVGAAMFIRTELFKIIGYFDPLFFLYHEEGDLCRRARYHGFQIHIIPDARILHWHTQLHPGKMSLTAKFAALYGYYFFIIKDPFRPVTENYYRFLQQIQKSIFRERKISKIVKRLAINTVVVFMAFLFTPLLLSRRKLDMKEHSTRKDSSIWPNRRNIL
jgi:GT2 family glycosyltransferase